ncbi:MAG: dockerin type I repeat-containing protein [Clostridia bacterium]|nr:dockerin type I repeat-containing protein [Clostridia bacterium]
MKRLLSIILTLAIIICAVPMGSFMFKVDAATQINESVFQSKYKTFKEEKYRDGSIYVNNPSSTGGYECFGYANEIAKYIFGSYPTSSGSAISNLNSNWDIKRGATAIDTLHIGDIVRFRNGSYDHSIFVYNISGNTVYYTDANGGNVYNKVASDKITKDELKTKISRTLIGNTSVLGYVAHYKNWQTVTTLTMKYNVNGGRLSGNVYTVAADGVGLWLRASYSTSSNQLVLIPDDTILKITETKTSGGYTWGKTTYDGKTGWCAISVGAVQTYYLNSSMVYLTQTKGLKTNVWKCGVTYPDGLINDTTLGLERPGYTFVGWSLKADGSSTVFDQNDGTIKAETIYPDVKNASATITLYAIWHKHIYSNDCDTTCDDCGQVRDVLGHNYGDFTITVEPTCVENGFKQKDCSICGDVITETIPATSIHSYDDDFDDTCNHCDFIRDIKKYGDANGDGSINGKDYALVLQSINGWDVTIDTSVADVNDDGKLNGKDYALLLQFINGWDVELK